MRKLSLVFVILLAVALVGCGSAVDSGASLADSAGGNESAPLSSSSGKGGVAIQSGSGTDDRMVDPSADGGGYDDSVELSEQQSGLKAGEVDDNERFRDYLAYRGRYSGEAVHDVDVTGRYVVSVEDAGGDPVLGATVRVESDGEMVFEAPTLSDGRVLFMMATASYELAEQLRFMADVGEISAASNVELDPAGGEVKLVLEGDWEPSEPVALDVLYLVDSTGSMADEIELLKTSLVTVAVGIREQEVPVALRMGMVLYRDRGEDYVTEVYDFEQDIEAFAERVKGVDAEGGGDQQESLNEGLHEAVSGVSWREGEGVRLVLLVSDAGPHLDYEQDWDYSVEMMKAQAAGIKVHAVATSGLDAFGEYVFRQIAQYTQGKFVFLLYGGGTAHDVEQFSEENLDSLIVDLVRDELAPLVR